MSVDIHYEQLSEARWTELLSQIQQHQVVRMIDCGIMEGRCRDMSCALRDNPALTELDLSSNELGDRGLRLLLQHLGGPGCKLQKLNLQNCSLTDAGCGTLRDLLCAVPTLRELYLSYNPLGDPGLQVLCEGLLDPQCRIEKLQVEYCNLTATSGERLAQVLRAQGGLKELMLNNNELGEAGARALCRGLADSACLLESLKLESCGLTSASCQDLRSIMASKASLRELFLGNNPLGDAGVAELCAGLLSPSSQLRILWLWECDLTSRGCRDLCHVLKAKGSLKEFSVAGNALGDEGARLLCDSLAEPGCGLECLWVKSCGFTSACCQHFSAMLAQNKRLLELQLSSNKLGDAGVQELCRSLSQPGAALRELWLGDCEVTNGGCSSLASLLLTNHSLRHLDLSNNCLSDAGVQLLAESLRQPSCSLEKLVMFDIYWTEEMDNQLRALEESKPSLKIIS